jgi:hypothetical protein
MPRLESVANLAMIVAAVAIIGDKAYDRLHPARRPASAAFATKYLGRPFPGLSSFPVRDGAPSVLLFFSSRCHYCSESMPFYKRLTSLRSATSGFAMVGIYPQGVETEADEEAYLAEHGVALDALGPMSFSQLMLPGTPTLLLLDQSKAVRGIWTGRLSHDKEEEVLQRLHALCPRCGGRSKGT